MTRPAFSLGVNQKVNSLVVSILAGQALATFVAHTAKVIMPQTGKIIGITLNVGLRGGTHSTSTVDVLAGATSLLAALFNVTSLTPGTPVNKEGSALAAGADSVAKDTVLSITSAESGGTSPTWADVTVQIDYVPLGD
jgi:hypothetical protein